MIQLYLLILILVFVIILCNKKEMFQNGGVGYIDKEISKSDLQCANSKHRVESWGGDGVHLYGCNSLYKDEPNDVSQVGIKLFWNKSDIETSKTILIVNTEDVDDTFIIDISDSQTDIPLNTVPNTVQQPIKTYELKNNIIEGKTYFITVNYVKPDSIYVSNTLRITALSPVPHTDSSVSNIGQQNLMNLLRNKTFDIYL